MDGEDAEPDVTGVELPDLPDASEEQGVVPRVIKTIIQRRSQVKQLLKKEKNPSTKIQLDTRQKALKLTANR